eukprot:Hpha_TRINITY_DN36496_c0_g1::TRINITY_DN36496_c0_g1_i1::g.20128::m.20128
MFAGEGFSDGELAAQVDAASGGVARLERTPGQGRFVKATSRIPRGTALLQIPRPIVRSIAPSCAAGYCPITTEPKPRAISMAEKVGLIFRRFDSGGSGRWKLADIQHCSLALYSAPPSPEDFSELCEILGENPEHGLSLKSVLRMYENVSDASADYAKVFSTRRVARYPRSLYPRPSQGGDEGYLKSLYSPHTLEGLPQAVEAQVKLALAWASAALSDGAVQRWAQTLWVPEEEKDAQALRAMAEGAEEAARRLNWGPLGEAWLLRCLLGTRYNGFGINVPAPVTRLP